MTHQAQTAAETGERDRLTDWLLGEARLLDDSAELLGNLAQRLIGDGVSLSRADMLVRSLHPDAVGMQYTWQRGVLPAESPVQSRSLLRVPEYLDSPYAAIDGGAAFVQRRLDAPGECLDFPVLRAYGQAGGTEYLALPVAYRNEKLHALGLTTDRTGGFRAREPERIEAMLPYLAPLLEVHSWRATARTLLDTYLGRHTGERVLNGLIRRGDGEDIHAVIWFCDLRQSTAMAESMPREAFLGVLNEFFDCMAGAVLAHGGEVLRFIGDAALAIFPTGQSDSVFDRGCCDTESSCRSALEAAKDALARVSALNATRARKNLPPLHYGLALHMGDVTYGNIGVPERLEFTVIGAAANETARMESMCERVRQPLLISAEFQHCFPGELVSVGRHQLRGVRGDRELFTLPARDQRAGEASRWTAPAPSAY